MTTPTSWSPSTTVSLSGDSALDSLLIGTKWASGVITYSFATNTSVWSSDYGLQDEPYTGYGTLTAEDQLYTKVALSSWSNVSNLTFVQVAENSSTVTVGDIRFAYSDLLSDAQAWAYTPENTASAGDIWINSDGTSYEYNWTLGSYEFLTVVHELGHALGLDHPFFDLAKFGPTLPQDQDYLWNSVMSYSAQPGEENAYLDFYPTTPMSLDIQAMQYLYGTNMSFHAGNDTYTFSQGSHYLQTIWDAGGVDTIKYVATSLGCEIDLRSGEWSQLGLGVGIYNESGFVRTEYDTVSIYDTVIIENAIGSNFDDLIQGNVANNSLSGGGGRDTLEGGAGNDTLNGGMGADLLSGGDGNDTYISELVLGPLVLGQTSPQTLDTYADDTSGVDTIKYTGVLSSTAFATFDLFQLTGYENIDISATGATKLNLTGNDDANVLTGNSANNTLTGGVGNDTLVGGAGNDNLSGDAGNDYLDGGTGIDVMTGGLGSDTYVIDNIGDVISGELSSDASTTLTQADSSNFVPSISADGRYVAFESYSEFNFGNNVVARDVFVKDMQTGLLIKANDYSEAFANEISADGQFLLYTTSAAMVDDTNNVRDIYLKDLQTGTTTIITTSSSGELGNAAPMLDVARISDDGKFISFTSYASNFAENDINDNVDVFIKDLTTGTTTLVSSNSSGVQANTGSAVSSISANGRYVTFHTDATNLDATDTNGDFDVYWKDTQTGELRLVSSSASGVVGNGTSWYSSVSADGNLVAFESDADNLVLDDTNSVTDIFVKNIQTGEITRISTSASDAQTNDYSENASFSADGRYIIFESNASNLIDGDTNSSVDIFVKDLQTGAIQRVSTDSNNQEANGDSSDATISDNGRYVVFTSSANNLVLGDTNNVDDVFVKDLQTGELKIASLQGTFNAGNSDIDTVKSSISYTLGSNVENLTLTGVAAIKATGNELDNILTGNSTANILTGGLGNDKLFGGAGADTLDGGVGADTMEGSDGADIYIVDDVNDTVTETNSVLATGGTDLVRSSALNFTLSSNVENLTLTGLDNINGTGNASNNNITGNAGNNIIEGDAGNDKLVGGLGNDILDGGIGNDNMNGGAGSDTYYVDSISDILTESLNLAQGGGIDLVQSNVTRTLGTNFDNLALTGSDHINGTGNDLANIIIGNEGNNLLSGGAGIDQINGDSGDDTLDGGVGIDDLIGGAGNDTYVIDNAGDTIVEGVGDSSDSVKYNIATVVAKTLTVGSDIFTNIENIIVGGAGLYSLVGDTNNNIFIGNASINTLTGNAGNDNLNGGAGADILIGGIGEDTYVVDNVGDKITELFDEGSDTVQSSVTYSLVDTDGVGNNGGYVENLTLTGITAINGTGNALGNILRGNDAANILDGKADADAMYGGKGADTYLVDNVGDTVTETLAEGIDTVRISAAYNGSSRIAEDNVDNIDASLFANGIHLTGNALVNTLTGGAGNDTLDGGAGNDVLKGNAGNDTLDGEAGVDVLQGGAGNDTYFVDLVQTGTTAITYRVALQDSITEVAGDDTLKLRGSFDHLNATTLTLAGTLENLDASQTDSTKLNLTGNALNNNITGNDASNIINGSGGNDTLSGGLGHDTLIGGTGQDVFAFDSIGANNYDLISDFVSGQDKIYLSGADFSSQLSTGIYTDMFVNGATALDADDFVIYNKVTGELFFDADGSGVGLQEKIAQLNANTNLLQSDFINAIPIITTPQTLFGTADADRLYGGTANDSLSGLTGNDTLTGSSGNDTFLFNAVGASNYDVISDFVSGQDKIHLSGATFSTQLSPGIYIDTFVNGTTALDANDFIIYNKATGELFFDADGSGVGLQEKIAQLNANTDLQQSDFVNALNTSQAGGLLIIGTNASESLYGGNNNDTIYGGDGFDGIYGNDGNDSLTGGVEADNIYGGNGNDTIWGGDFLDNLYGDAGDDVIYGEARMDNLYGGDGNDTLYGGDADDSIDPGNDQDVVDGGDGNDGIFSSNGSDTLTGGAGGDMFSFNSALGASNIDVITDFTPGFDTIRLNTNVFTFNSLSGALVSGAGAVALDSNDYLVYDTNTGALYYDADADADAAGVQQQFATLIGIPELQTSNFSWFTI